MPRPAPNVDPPVTPPPEPERPAPLTGAGLAEAIKLSYEQLRLGPKLDGGPGEWSVVGGREPRVARDTERHAIILVFEGEPMGYAVPNLGTRYLHRRVGNYFQWEGALEGEEIRAIRMDAPATIALEDLSAYWQDLSQLPSLLIKRGTLRSE